MRRKNFQITSFKAIAGNDQPGTFEALVSVFNNIDRADEVIVPGAFKNSIANSLPPVVWSHQWLTPPIGVTLEANETVDGLLVKGRLFIKPEENCPLAQHVYTAMTETNGDGLPALREWSVGLNVKSEHYEDRDGTQVTVLDELELIEYGPCLKGVNPATETVSVKALEDALDALKTKKLLPVTQLSFTDRGRPFDGNAARSNVRDYASDADGNVDLTKYDRAFLWVDDDAGDNLSGRRYIVADVVNGTLKYVPRAIFAAANVLNGGRGGNAANTIGQDGVDALKKSVEALYARMRHEFNDDTISVPWSQKAISDSTQENEPDPTNNDQETLTLEQKRALVAVFLD